MDESDCLTPSCMHARGKNARHDQALEQLSLYVLGADTEYKGQMMSACIEWADFLKQEEGDGFLLTICPHLQTVHILKNSNQW